MKEIRLSFEITIPLRQTDVHWVEEELLRVREEVYLGGVLAKVMEEIEAEALSWMQQCGAEKRNPWGKGEESEGAHEGMLTHRGP